MNLEPICRVLDGMFQALNLTLKKDGHQTRSKPCHQNVFWWWRNPKSLRKEPGAWNLDRNMSITTMHSERLHSSHTPQQKIPHSWQLLVYEWHMTEEKKPVEWDLITQYKSINTIRSLEISSAIRNTSRNVILRRQKYNTQIVTPKDHW